MIGMRMGEDDRIHPPDIFPQRLGPKIGTGIDDKSHFRRFDINGRSEALIPRINGAANGAIAADRRDALGSTRAEKGERELRVEGCEWRWQTRTLNSPLYSLNYCQWPRR
jgi:hypothetical protein